MFRNAVIFSLLLSLAGTSWADERAQATIDARQGLLEGRRPVFWSTVGIAKGKFLQCGAN